MKQKSSNISVEAFADRTGLEPVPNPLGTEAGHHTKPLPNNPTMFLSEAITPCNCALLNFLSDRSLIKADFLSSKASTYTSSQGPFPQV